MIEQQLPDVDTVGAYDVVTNEIARDHRRRSTMLAAGTAAAALLVAAGVTAWALTHDSGDVQPAPAPPGHVLYQDGSGRASIVATDGSGSIQLPGHVEDAIAWSPDGTQIAYVGDNNPDLGGWLWIANADGSGANRLPRPCKGCSATNTALAWSHDGTKIVYEVFTPGDAPMQLRILTLASGAERMIQIPSWFKGPQWSPDDRLLVMVCPDDEVGLEYICTLDPVVGLSSVRDVSDPYTRAQRPSWSADGQTIYFTAGGESNPLNDTEATVDVYAVAADGTDLRQLTHAGARERYWGAEPHGDKLLTGHVVGAGPMTVGWLTLDGSSFTPLTDADGQPVEGYFPKLQPEEQ